MASAHPKPQSPSPASCSSKTKSPVLPGTHRAYPCFLSPAVSSILRSMPEHPSKFFYLSMTLFPLTGTPTWPLSPVSISPVPQAGVSPNILFSNFYLLIYLWRCCGRGLFSSCGRGCSPAAEHGLLRRVGFSRCGAGLRYAAKRGVFRIRNRTRVSCIGDSFPLSLRKPSPTLMCVSEAPFYPGIIRAAHRTVPRPHSQMCNRRGRGLPGRGSAGPQTAVWLWASSWTSPLLPSLLQMYEIGIASGLC